MSCFSIDEKLAFYLQDYYVKDWVDNTMVFLEVADVAGWFQRLQSMNLPEKFEGVRLQGIVREEWGEEFFLHDPAGVLWHIGAFKK